jgi:hypothetical protein
VPGPEENNSLDVQSSTSTTAIIDHGWKPDALPLKSIMAASGFELSGRGIPDRNNFYPLTSYNFASISRSIPGPFQRMVGHRFCMNLKVQYSKQNPLLFGRLMS